MTLAAGFKLGPYEILSPVGAGGMGEVYRARDARLGREVAVKVLPERTAGDPDALSRFHREARAIAALSHPNILSIFDFGTSDGTAYAVMELLAGESLRDAVDAPLPPARAIDYGLQIARGLCAAHEKGVVHRDLKPENVFLTRDGTVKILDFGLAKRIDGGPAEEVSSAPTETHATADGIVMGTVAYMSPEQVRGEKVDARSDIFSFGSILFEMLTGKKAFHRGSPAETMAAILKEEPEIPERLIPAASALASILRHCLEKSADRRYQTARDLLFNLQQFGSGAVGSGPVAAAPAAPSVAVLPFRNFAGDAESEFFADGITEDVIANLAKIRSLKVISRTSAMAFRSRDRSLREIGATLGAGAVLDGSIRRAGNRVRIVAQLVDARTDENLWADTYDRDMTDVFAIQTDVAVQIAAALKAQLSPDEVARIEKKPTANSHAYELYLQGRRAYYRSTVESYRQAIGFFQQAIAEDPKLAIAHATLALTHAEMAAQGEGFPSAAASLQKAREEAAKALALDPDLGDAHCVTGMVMFMNDYDWTGAEREFRQALELSPGNSDIHDKYGWMCSAMGRSDDALRLLRRARELDPLAHGSDIATELVRAGRYAEALEEAKRYTELEPNQIRGHSVVGWAHILMGDFERGLPSLEHAVTLSRDNTLFLGQLGQAYAMSGQTGRAREILEKLRIRSQVSPVSPYHFAYVHTGLGEKDEAIGWLEKAFEERTGAIYGIKGSFLFKPLHGHPRFQALLAKMNLS